MSQVGSIEGLEDTLKFFDQAPENLIKVTKTALRDASSVSARNLRRRIPERWRKLVKFKVKLMGSGNLIATFGLFNGHQVQGNQSDPDMLIADWFKAYWSNYGTLENRDPTHQFKNPVKHHKTAAARRRKGAKGIQPRRFFDEGIAGWSGPFLDAFKKSMKKQEAKLYER